MTTGVQVVGVDCPQIQQAHDGYVYGDSTSGQPGHRVAAR